MAREPGRNLQGFYRGTNFHQDYGGLTLPSYLESAWCLLSSLRAASFFNTPSSVEMEIKPKISCIISQ